MKVLVFIVMGFFAAGALLMRYSDARLAVAERRSRWLKYVVYLGITTTVLATAQTGKAWLAMLMSLILARGAWEINSALRHVTIKKFAQRIWASYAILSITVLFSTYRLHPETTVYVYIVIAVFDGFSQVFGQFLGRHRLAAHISPNKTVEGALGGGCAAIAVAILARPLVAMDISEAIQVGLLMSLTGLAGDLSASWLKRQAQIKDYGSLLPGHGGILDRFDSFLPALALAGIWLT